MKLLIDGKIALLYLKEKNSGCLRFLGSHLIWQVYFAILACLFLVHFILLAIEGILIITSFVGLLGNSASHLSKRENWKQ